MRGGDGGAVADGLRGVLVGGAFVGAVVRAVDLGGSCLTSHHGCLGLGEYNVPLAWHLGRGSLI